MKEFRVFVVNCDLYEGEEVLMELSDEAFMDIAEAQGSVYSLKGFEWDFNDEKICCASCFIRILEVEAYVERFGRRWEYVKRIDLSRCWFVLENSDGKFYINSYEGYIVYVGNDGEILKSDI